MFGLTKTKSTISPKMLKRYMETRSCKLPVCHAPFSSLYFFPNGEVGSCCLNKTGFNLGVYPKNSTTEIIESKNRKLQQKNILANNLSLGCSICNENINSGNFTGVMAYDYNRLKTENKIRRIDFELSDYCNLDCIMCERDKKKDKSIYNDNFIKEIYPLLLNLEATNFLGGEPFLIKLYYDIWDILFNKNPDCNINIQSNGSIINDRIINIVSHEKVFLSLSIDSVNKDTYEKIRKQADFEVLMKNFNIFNSIMKEKQHSMYISVCPIAYNIKEIPEIVRFANENECRLFFNRVTLPSELSIDNRTTEEYESIIDFLNLQLEQLSDISICEKHNYRVLKDFTKLLYSQKEKSLLENKTLISNNYIIEILNKRTNSSNRKYMDIVRKAINNNQSKWFISQIKIDSLNNAQFWKTYENMFNENTSEKEIVVLVKEFLELENYKIPII